MFFDLIRRNTFFQLTIVVPGEFEFQVAVFGEAETERWLLLNVNMLVDDYEIGFGVDLIHPSQMLLVHQVLQSRINEAQNVSFHFSDFF